MTDYAARPRLFLGERLTARQREQRLREARALGPASRRQPIAERLHPNAVRVLVLCREHGATMIGEAGVAVLDLMRRGYVLVTPQGKRFCVQATPEGLAAIEAVQISDQDQRAERKPMQKRPTTSRVDPGERWKRWG